MSMKSLDAVVHRYLGFVRIFEALLSARKFLEFGLTGSLSDRISSKFPDSIHSNFFFEKFHKAPTSPIPTLEKSKRYVLEIHFQLFDQ